MFATLYFALSLSASVVCQKICLHIGAMFATFYFALSVSTSVVCLEVCLHIMLLWCNVCYVVFCVIGERICCMSSGLPSHYVTLVQCLLGCILHYRWAHLLYVKRFAFTLCYFGAMFARLYFALSVSTSVVCQEVCLHIMLLWCNVCYDVFHIIGECILDPMSWFFSHVMTCQDMSEHIMTCHLYTISLISVLTSNIKSSINVHIIKLNLWLNLVSRKLSWNWSSAH